MRPLHPGYEDDLFEYLEEWAFERFTDETEDE